MNSYKRCLEIFESLVDELALNKGERELMFDRPVVIAADIAEQFYCEKKVELSYLYGKVETEAMLQGTEGHEKLVEGSTEVAREELFRQIFENKSIFVLEMLLLGKYGNVVLCGKPDSVFFSRSIPLLISEYKFSRRPITYPSYHVQARTYGLLLEKIGFDTTKLFYAIVVADPSARLDQALKERVTLAIKEYGLKEAIISLGNAKVYLHKYERASAEKNIDWALEFWLKKRSAIATSNFGKCRSCEYFTRCRR